MSQYQTVRLLNTDDEVTVEVGNLTVTVLRGSTGISVQVLGEVAPEPLGEIDVEYTEDTDE